VFEHVPVQPRDAREASDVFYKQRTGDALLTYENEVIVTNQSYGAAKALPYVLPQYNISVRGWLMFLEPWRVVHLLCCHACRARGGGAELFSGTGSIFLCSIVPSGTPGCPACSVG
jgi:hypothetical protein